MRQGTVFKILLVFRPRAGGEPRVNKHIWPSEESGLLDGRYIVYAGREGKNCSKNSFILTNRILQSTLWRTYSVQVKTQNAFVSYRITSPYFGLVFGDIWSGSNSNCLFLRLPLLLCLRPSIKFPFRPSSPTRKRALGVFHNLPMQWRTAHIFTAGWFKCHVRRVTVRQRELEKFVPRIRSY